MVQVSDYPCYIGIGSNLDYPVQQVSAALGCLAQLNGCSLGAVSAFYRNPPLIAPGVPEQPDYINAVARVDTLLAPERLLDQLQAIEVRQQRRRTAGVRWGPRSVDLDLLVYAQQSVDSDRLQVPHPGLAYRPFAVFPLAEIEPQLTVPGLGPISDLAAQLDGSQLQRIKPPAPGCESGGVAFYE